MQERERGGVLTEDGSGGGEGGSSGEGGRGVSSDGEGGSCSEGGRGVEGGSGGAEGGSGGVDEAAWLRWRWGRLWWRRRHAALVAPGASAAAGDSDEVGQR